MAMRVQYRERVFRRKAELTDTARSYRKHNAELDPNNEQSLRLSAFYTSECCHIEDEIRSLLTTMLRHVNLVRPNVI